MAKRSQVRPKRPELTSRHFIYDEDIAAVSKAATASKPPLEVVPIAASKAKGAEPQELAMLDLAMSFCGLAHLYEVGAEIDRRTTSGYGRPRRNDAFVYLLIDVLASRVGSERKTLVEIRNRIVWREIRDQVRANWPDVRIDDRPPTRSGFLRFKRRMRFNPELVALYRDATIDWTIAVGRTMGLMTDANDARTTPDPANTMVSDGTWINSVYNAAPGTRGARRVNRTTGEITPVRSDPDSIPYHGEGTGGAGRYWIINSARTASAHERLIYECALLPTGADEGMFAVEQTIALERLGLDIRGLAYDMGVKGRSYERLLLDGIVPITKVPRLNGHVPTWSFGPTNAKTRAGTVQVDLWAIDGALRIRVPDEEGRPGYLLLDRKKIEFRPSAVYLIAEVPDLPEAPRALIGARVRVRLTSSPADEAAGFLRGTYLRALAPAFAEFEALYALRNNIESVNEQLKAHLPRRRQRSVGSVLQVMNLVSHQVATNLCALIAWLRRTGGDVRGVWAKPPPDIFAGPVAEAA